MFYRGLVGLPVHAGRARAVAACKPGVGEAVEGGDFAGGVARDAGTHTCGLQDRDGTAGPFEGQRGGHPGDARPDDRDVDLKIPAQGGIIGGSGGGNPKGDGFTFGPSTVRCGIHRITSGSGSPLTGRYIAVPFFSMASRPSQRPRPTMPTPRTRCSQLSAVLNGTKLAAAFMSMTRP